MHGIERSRAGQRRAARRAGRRHGYGAWPVMLGAAALSCLAWVGAVISPQAACAQSGGGAKAEKASSVVAARLLETVRTLSASEMDGRGPGTEGLDAARDLVVERFRAAGLKPAGANGGYLQPFTPENGGTNADIRLPEGKAWGSVELANVVGILPGSGGPDAACVVVGAHYDHLGRTAAGAVYPGADDNASGVAVLLELASRLAEAGPYRHSLVFVAFSGEEEGTLGSRRYIAAPACPLERTLAMLNLDTIGRMEGEKLFVFGASTAVEFGPMLQGVRLAVPLELVVPESGPFASDHVPFFEKGVPALHFFTGPNADYHRPTDLTEKVNVDGLLEILDFTAEAVVFLAEREERLTFVPPGAAQAAQQFQGSGPARKVSLGTIPDFERQSGGVLVSGTVPGSPAEAAGLKKGDIIVSLGDAPCDNLGEYSAALKQHQPGDTVEVVFRRGTEEMRLRVGLVERK